VLSFFNSLFGLLPLRDIEEHANYMFHPAMVITDYSASLLEPDFLVIFTFYALFPGI
jgi:hypothetical protein